MICLHTDISSISLPCRLRLYNTPTASLQRSKTPTNKCSRYDIKQSDGEVPVSFGERGVPLHCHRSQVHFSPEW